MKKYQRTPNKTLKVPIEKLYPLVSSITDISEDKVRKVMDFYFQTWADFSICPTRPICRFRLLGSIQIRKSDHYKMLYKILQRVRKNRAKGNCEKALKYETLFKNMRKLSPEILEKEINDRINNPRLSRINKSNWNIDEGNNRSGDIGIKIKSSQTN